MLSGVVRRLPHKRGDKNKLKVARISHPSSAIIQRFLLEIGKRSQPRSEPIDGSSDNQDNRLSTSGASTTRPGVGLCGSARGTGVKKIPLMSALGHEQTSSSRPRVMSVILFKADIIIQAGGVHIRLAARQATLAHATDLDFRNCGFGASSRCQEPTFSYGIRNALTRIIAIVALRQPHAANAPRVSKTSLRPVCSTASEGRRSHADDAENHDTDEAGNRTIKDGSLPKILEGAVARLKAEAAYFVAEDGVRTAMIFFDIHDSSDIPAIVEPLFMGIDAEVELLPVMNADDLRKGLKNAMEAM